MNSKTVVKILIAVVVIAGFLYLLHVLPVKDKLDQFVSYVQGQGTLGVVIFIAGYVVAGLLFPASILTLGAGAAFGPVVGTVAVSIASVTCACVAFLIGRYAARGFIEKKMAAFPKFQAVDKAVAQQGFKIVLLTRLSPAFPFTWMNYGYGITKVRFRDFVLASWIGMLPGTAMYVYLGFAARAAAQTAAGGGDAASTGKKVLLGVGLLATIVVTVFVTKIARKALADAVPGDVPPATPTAA